MATKEYLKAMRQRYRVAKSRLSKGRILDEICATCGWHRKHALRALGKRAQRRGAFVRERGRPRLYAQASVQKALEAIWLASNMPCGKRLKAMIPLWLPGYEALHGALDADVRERLLEISAATSDRLLKKTREKHTMHGRATTKPGTLMRNKIPIATGQWTQREPGFIEADTVAHCGTSMAGQFVFTLDCVDLATGWTEQRAVWAKADHAVVTQMRSIERALPFPLRGFDSDNGSEFINHLLFKHFIDRKTPVLFTRSRAYHKDDNAHVEQKNWTHVRQWLGYERLDNPAVVAPLNALYENEWRLFQNFYCASVKLLTKERVGSKTVKTYDKPKTPYQRVLESEQVSDYAKTGLRRIFDNTNPFLLRRAIEKRIDLVFKAQNTVGSDTIG